MVSACGPVCASRHSNAYWWRQRFAERVCGWVEMATDYDAPRKTDEDAESIEALKERVPDQASAAVDVEDADNPGFELAGADLSGVDLDVVVLPQQEDEFTCVECFLVRHRSQMDHETKLGPVCRECSA